MTALLTYRSRDSFESRFGRNVPKIGKGSTIGRGSIGANTPTLAGPENEHFSIHNDGHRHAGVPRHRSTSNSIVSSPRMSISGGATVTDVGTPNGEEIGPAEEVITVYDPEVHGATPIQTTVPTTKKKKATTYFTAQSYLRYQGDKFIKRFDANCYIAITRKLDTHDISAHCEDPASENPLQDALNMIKQPTLVLGIKSDGLFTFAEQEEIARGIPNARLETIESPEGHDAFLLQFEQVNRHILDFFKQVLPEILERGPTATDEGSAAQGDDYTMAKSSTFGEAEVEDITAW